MYRIFIVEDHPIIRQGYAALIGREVDMEVCGEAVSVTEAMERIPLVKPDLVIVDISLGEMSGLDLLARLQQAHPELPALVVSGHDESVYGDAVHRLGAKGYITKESPHMFVETIRRILKGPSDQPHLAANSND